MIILSFVICPLSFEGKAVSVFFVRCEMLICATASPVPLQLLVKRPILEEKPGFYAGYRTLTETLGRNPVSEPQ